MQGPLDQDIENIEEDQIIDIEIIHTNNVILNMSIRESCTLNQVWADLQHEAVQLPKKVFFKHHKKKVTLYSLCDCL